MATVPSSRGTPTRANSKKPKGRAPASAAASETTTLTGVPVRASSDPAWAAKATGSSSCDGGRPRRTAITTTTGTRAATEPLGLIRAVSRATTTMVRTSSRVRLSPARAISCCPTQAVTPVASRASLTTKRVAMKMTEESPKPARAWLRVSTPVA